jgi:hypothetical protein
MKIHQLHPHFRPRSPEYPKGIVEPSIEEYALSWLTTHAVDSQASYLPCFWNAYMHLLKNSAAPLRTSLTNMLKNLHGKLYTVSQYDDDIIPRPECLKVASAAGSGDYAIPFIPHDWGVKTDANPRFLAGFVGNVETNPGIRGPLIEFMDGKDEYFVARRNWTDKAAFRFALENCRFMMCPRGYGKTSYRLYEAIQAGCIPVYYSDEWWLPFEDEIKWDRLAIIAHPSHLHEEICGMKTMPEAEIKDRREYGQYVMKEYFAPDKIMERIKRWIERT